MTRKKIVTLDLVNGSLNEGFLVTLRIGDLERNLNEEQTTGRLPPFPQLLESLASWQRSYKSESGRAKAVKKTQHFEEPKPADFLANKLKEDLNSWLNSLDSQWQKIRDSLQQSLDREDEIIVIIQTDDNNIKHLPWQEWDLFKDKYEEAEIVLSPTNYRTYNDKITPQERVRVLGVFGYSSDINITRDLDAWKKLAEIQKLHLELLPSQPTERITKQQILDKLWDKSGWQIFFFAGHSFSENDWETGRFQINETEKLEIQELKNALREAIKKGLKIAIFNSCDGLGLANQLAKLNLPQSIVMRQPVPDEVAPYFLQDFLENFTQHCSFHLSVNKAKRMLEDSWDKKYPGVSWLPIICQNPATKILNWSDLYRSKSTINREKWYEAIRRIINNKLGNSPLGFGAKNDFNLYVDLGLTERKNKPKHKREEDIAGAKPQEKQAEENEIEITRTFKGEEFFQQIIGQNSQGKRVAIIGEPGAGKTTSALKLADWLLSTNSDYLPIWISLADLKQGQSLEEYLHNDWLKKALQELTVTQEYKEALINLLAQGQVWLLLDGVDELSSNGNLLKTILDQLQGWADKINVLLTCRFNVWDANQDELYNRNFEVYRTQSVIALLLKRKGEGDYSLRMQAVKSLGEIRTDEAVDALLSFLDDSDKSVRKEVFESLGKIGTDKAVEALLSLKNNSDDWVPRKIVESLRKIGTDKAVETLFSLKDDSNSWVRREVVKSLGKIGTDRAIEALLSLKDDSADFVRREVFKSLGTIRTDKAVDALLSLKDHSDSGVRIEIVKSLGEIKTDKAFDALLSFKDYPVWLVRREVVVSLGKIGTDKAVDALLSLKDDPNHFVRKQVAESLGTIGTDKAVDALLSLKNDPND